MNYSQLAFQGYLEKTGLSISESEYIAANARISFSSYLEQVAEIMPVAGKKNAKAEASRIILLSNLVAGDKKQIFIFMKAFIAVASYQFGEDSNYDEQLTNFFDKDKCIPVLHDPDLMQQIKEQFIASKTLGSRKGVWSKFFG